MDPRVEKIMKAAEYIAGKLDGRILNVKWKITEGKFEDLV